MFPFGFGSRSDRTKTATSKKVGGRKASARYVPRCESLEARTLLSFGIDPTFGMGGQVQTALTATGGPQSIAVQPDGKILAVGSVTNSSTGQDFAVVRYNTDGSLDTSFGSGGEVTTDFTGQNDRASALALQANGQIVVAGMSAPATMGSNEELALARYNPNGQLDSTFGSGGKVLSTTLTGASSIALQSDGHVLVGTSGSLIRLNSDGSLDTTFGTGGSAPGVVPLPANGTNITDLVIQLDGKILEAGDAAMPSDPRSGTTSSGYFIVRYSANGALDSTFGQAGTVTDFITYDYLSHSGASLGLNQLAMQADGKIVAVGSYTNLSYGGPSYNGFEIRLNPDGSSDTGFHPLESSIPFTGTDGVVIQPDGMIVTLNDQLNFDSNDKLVTSTFLSRQNPNGSIDLGFGLMDKVMTPFRGTLTLQADGKLLVATTGNPLTLARYGPGHSIYAVGADAGGGPEVKTYDATSGALKLDFFAYDPNFHGGVRVAVGDVNSDGVPDIITAPGPGGGPELKVFDGLTGKVLMDFMAFDPNFSGGVFVAAGDVNGDGHADIIAGADAGGGPNVTVFSGADGTVVQSFFAYDPNFHGGVRVAAGDITGQGTADIITAPGPGGRPNVKVFDSNGNVQQSFFAYDPSFSGGVYVAAADVNGDGHADIITGAGPGGGPNIKVFSGADGSVLESFFAYDPGFHGGVRVGALTTSAGVAELLTGAGPGGGPSVGVLSATGQMAVDSFFAYDPNFPGGVFIGGA
jgi:uncharacterized delta-60 repeat protein